VKLSRENLRALINEMNYLAAPSSDIQASETPAFPSVDEFVSAADPGEHDSDYGSEQGMFQSETPTINGRMNELLLLARKLINLENAFAGIRRMDGVFGSQEAEESKWYVDLYYLIEDRVNRVKSGVYDKPGKRQEQEFNLGFQVITQKLTNMINNMARHFTVIAKGIGGFFKLNNLLKMVGLNIFESKMHPGRKYTEEELESAEALNDAHFGVRNGYQIVRSMINIVRDPMLSEVYLSDIERLLVAIKTQFETGDAIFTMKESYNKGNKMKITKKQLRNLINEIVMLDDDGGFSGYAGLDKVGPDHALNQQAIYKKIPGGTRPRPSAPEQPAKPVPPTQEEIINAIKRAAADIDREKDNAYTHFAKISQDARDGYGGVLQDEVNKFMNIPTRNLIQDYLGLMMQRNITASRFRSVLESMLSNKADIKTLYHFKIEDLDAVFGAEPVALNESLSRGSLYRRRYYGRY
jgi:hypothetical protein